MVKSLKQATFFTIGNILTLALQWIILMLIPRIGNFSDAGVFTVAISLCSLFNPIATLSMYQYQVSDQYRKYTENDYFVCRVYTVLLSFILCGITVFLFSYDTEHIFVTIGYLIYRNLINSAEIYSASLQIGDRLDYVGKCTILEGTASGISFLAIYYFTTNLIVSTISMAIIGGGIFVLTLGIGYKRHFKRVYPHDIRKTNNLKKLIFVGIPLTTSFLTVYAITALPKIVLDLTFDSHTTGIFGTLTAPTIIIPTIVTSVFTIFLMRIQDNYKDGNICEVKKFYLKSIVYIALFGIFGLILSFFFAEWAFTQLYGETIREYVHYFHYLIIGITFYAIGMVSILVYIAENRGKILSIETIISFLFSAVLITTTVPNNGIEQATLSLVFSYIVLSIILFLGVIIEKKN